MNKGGNVEEIQPVGNLNMPKNEKKPKKLLRKVIAVIIAIALAVGAFFLVRFIIEKVNENAGIKVGDTVITKKQIETAEKEAEEYKKKSPNAAIDSTFAKNTLILNAALKNSLKECNAKEATLTDIYNFSTQSNFESVDDNTALSSLGPKDSFYFKTQENALYKNKLKDCLIQKKEVLNISISYETPYMDSSSKEEANEKYNQARNKLRSDFLPLIKSGAKKDEIAAKTDMNLLLDKSGGNFDFSRFEREIITVANIDSIDSEYGSAGYSTSKTTSAKGDLNLVDLNEEISKLNVGEYSDVLDTTSGIFSIVRVESSNSAKYSSWDDFLSKNTPSNTAMDNASEKKAYAYVHSGSVCYAVDHNSFTCQTAGGGHMISKPSFWMNNTVHRGDGRHLKAVRIRAWEGAVGGVPLNGVKTAGEAPGVSTRDTTEYASFNGLYGGAHAFSGNGYAFAIGDCNAGGLITINITAPSGYRYDGGQITSNIAGSNYTAYDSRDIVLTKKPTDAPNNISAQANSKVSVTRPSQTLPYSASIAENNTNSNKKGWAQNLYARVGDTVSFKHEITNFSATHSNWNIWFDWRTSGANEYTGEAHGWHIGTPNPRSGAILRYGNTTEVEAKTVGTSSRPFTVTASMVGKTICQKINWSLSGRKTRNGHLIENRANESGRELIGQSTTPACVYVAYDYELTPCVGTGSASCYSGDIPKIPGESIGLIPKVLNPNGNPTKQTAWKISHWKIPGNNEPIPTPNTAPDTNTFQNNPDPCSVYRTTFQNAFTTRDCSILSQGTNTMNDDTNEDLFRNTVSNFTVPKNAEIGSRYCFALSVSPYKLTPAGSQAQNSVTTTNQWRHSGAVCILVGKRPKMQIWGNGVYSKSGIKTSTTSVDGKLLGSWVEYEAITGQTVKGFFSESTNNSNKLTANNYTAETGTWGSSSSINNLINNITSRYGTAKSSVAITGNPTTPADIGSFGIVYNATSPIETHVVYAKNIRITSNVIAKNPQGANVKSFQQIIIIADNVYIDPNVTQIDAWLVSKNTITTCSHAGFQADISKVNYSSCGKPLTVNGPIIAKKLNSWRTGENSKSGDTETASSPSEIYNQRADIYMWAFSQASGDGKITTSYSKELPVRY